MQIAKLLKNKNNNKDKIKNNNNSGNNRGSILSYILEKNYILNNNNDKNGYVCPSKRKTGSNRIWCVIGHDK